MKTQARRSATIKKMLALATPQWRPIAIGTLFLLVAAGLNLSFPMLIGKLIEAIQGGGGKEIVNHYVLLLFGLFLVIGVSTFFRSYLFTVAGERIVAVLRQDLFHALLQQEIGFFDENRTGELTNRLASDTTMLQKAVTVNVSMGLRYFLGALGAIIILMLQSWELTLLMLATVPVVAGGAGVYGQFLRRISTQVQDALAASTGVAEESLGGIRTVRAFAREKFASQRYDEKVEVSFQLAKKRAFLGASFQGLIGFAAYAAICGVLWYGGTMLVDGEMSIGQLTSFMLYTFTVAFSVGALSGLYEDFAKALGASERVFAYLERRSIMPNGQQKPSKISGRLEFKQVSFAYPSRPEVNVLTDFSLTLKHGEVLALVGASGGGKSTVAVLTSRFYDPQRGEISLDDTPLPEWDKNWLRSQIGVVSQEPILFATSIRENIRYGNLEASEEAIVAAAKAANAHEFIGSFPTGYETLVGERGIRLSGGQKQRIAIARALLKDPKILILDEATSALDVESEHLVQEALERLMVGRTTMVIAHRLSTIQDADRVAVLQEGQVVELGTHRDLLAKQGVYFRLVERQYEQ